MGVLRGIINSARTRGSGVPRCHPDTKEPEFFEAFGPKAIGLKGLSVAYTTLGRSIIIEMERKLLEDRAEDFEHADDVELARLRSCLARFAQDNIEKLKHSIASDARRLWQSPGSQLADALSAVWR